MIIELREVSVAVKDVEAAAAKLRAMGFNPAPVYHDPVPLVESSSASVKLPNTHFGVMSSLGDNATPISRFIDKRGEGLFSFTFLVTKIEDVMDLWRKAGVDFVLDKTLEIEDGINAGNIKVPLLRVNWTRPSTVLGLCIELHEFRNRDGSTFDPSKYE